VPKKPQQLAKLSRPRLYDAVLRERLFMLLDEKRKHPAIWITGPPGSGKTTLVCSYLEDRKLRGIWYQVDAGDGDLSTFFYYLTEAAKALPSRKKPLPLLTPEYLPDVPGFARRYFRELFSRLPDAGILVLDNFQEAAQGVLDQVIGIAVSEVPGSMALMVISRAEPLAEFSKHLPNERLVVLGWDELKLRFDEARAIASARTELDVHTLKVLFEKSDGWAAGLTLMLERSRRDKPASADIGTASREAVFNYFAAQIFNTANAETRETLIRTSVFSSFSLQLAERISANPQAGKLLDELCQRQLFTYRRGTGEPRYQYHDLFREFLLQRMREALNSRDQQALMREAAILLAGHGAHEEAFHMYVLSADWPAATDLVYRFAPALLAQGRFRTLQEWILAHGDDRVQGNSWLLYWLGNASMQTDLAKAGELLARAFESFGAEHDPIGQCLCAAELIRVQYYQYDNFEPLDIWIAAFDRLLETTLTFPDPASEMKVCSALGLALSARQPGHPRLPKMLARTADLLDADIDVNQKVAAGMALFIHYTIANQLPQAQHIIEKVSPLLASPEVTALNRVYWWLQLGYYHFRRAANVEAEQAWEEADKFTEEHGLRQTDFIGRCFRAFHFAAKFDYRKGQEVLDGLEAKVTDARPSMGALYNLARCLLEMSRENGMDAAHYGRLALACALRTGRPFYRIGWRAQVAAALAMAGEHEAAEQLVEDAWRESEGTWLASYRSNLLMARAYSAIRQGLTKRAHESIREMLRIARENDSWAYLRTAPSVKDVVLEEALAAGIEVPFVQMMVRRFEMRPRRLDIEAWPWPVKVYSLGEFRIEVDGLALTFSRKAPKKPLALLKAIIAFGGRNVPEQKLVDALWPDEDVNSARESLTVSLHRLRKLLVHSDAVQLVEGQISLDPSLCWIDAWGFERATSESDRQPEKSAAADPVWRMYRGHFLAEEIDASWALSMRERLRGQFLRYISTVGRRHEEAGSLDVAVLLYQKGIEADDLAEELYQGLMRCHMRLDRRAEGMAAYRRLRQTLSVTLGISPSTQSEQLFKSLKGDPLAADRRSVPYP
jgi:LuxR family maltose regulon positive regulatory protein